MRENADHNNSKYGHFSRSAYHKQFACLHMLTNPFPGCNFSSNSQKCIEDPVKHLTWSVLLKAFNYYETLHLRCSLGF